MNRGPLFLLCPEFCSEQVGLNRIKLKDYWNVWTSWGVLFFNVAMQGSRQEPKTVPKRCIVVRCLAFLRLAQIPVFVLQNRHWIARRTFLPENFSAKPSFQSLPRTGGNDWLFCFRAPAPAKATRFPSCEVLYPVRSSVDFGRLLFIPGQRARSGTSVRLRAAIVKQVPVPWNFAAAQDASPFCNPLRKTAPEVSGCRHPREGPFAQATIRR